MGNIVPSKLTIIFILLITLYGCGITKKNMGNQFLLEKNILIKNNQELINDPIKFLLVDKPNKKVFGIPFKRNLYNLSVSPVKGFKGDKEALKYLAKTLKQSINTGGTFKDGEILIQGNYRDQIIDELEKMGHKVKRIGG